MESVTFQVVGVDRASLTSDVTCPDCPEHRKVVRGAPADGRAALSWGTAIIRGGADMTDHQQARATATSTSVTARALADGSPFGTVLQRLDALDQRR